MTASTCQSSIVSSGKIVEVSAEVSAMLPIVKMNVVFRVMSVVTITVPTTSNTIVHYVVPCLFNMAMNNHDSGDKLANRL